MSVAGSPMLQHKK